MLGIIFVLILNTEVVMTADKRPLLAKIHIAKAQLNLDDDQYRDIVRRITGKDSASKCRYSQLVDLINEFKALGWKTPKKKAFRRTPFDPIKKSMSFGANCRLWERFNQPTKPHLMRL